MSKDQWINQVEHVAEQFSDGEMCLDTAVCELRDLGMSNADIRKTLDPDGFLNIPEAYLK